MYLPIRFKKINDIPILVTGIVLVLVLAVLSYLVNYSPTQISNPVVSGASIGGGTGLEGYYFNSMDFSAFKTQRLDPIINFYWGLGSPISGVNSDFFSVRWLGQIQPQYSEVYTFYTLNDDGVRLFVNNQLIVDDWINQGTTEHTGQIRLVAGQRYDIKYEFYENTVNATCTLSWSSISQTKQLVPTSQLYPPSGVTNPTPVPVPAPAPAPTPTPTPTPVPVPTPTPIPTPVAAPTAVTATSPDLFGVNISGGEFGSNLPGTQNFDYIYPVSDLAYFANQNQKIIRIPFRWERVQHQFLGALSTPDVDAIKYMLDTAAANNEKVILDLHNFGRYYNTPLKKSDVYNFQDVWIKLATVFKNSPVLYGYELMNEPHDLPEGSDGWDYLAQAATNAIRQVDTTHYVIVPGYDWQSALRWITSNPNLNINDPAAKLLYSAHVYFDKDQSGAYANSYDTEGVTPTTGVDRLQPFISWLKTKNAKGIITEYGVPGNDSRYLTTLDNFLSAIKNEPSLVGGTYWSAGPWWGDYPLSVEPTGQTDKSQMSILKKY